MTLLKPHISLFDKSFSIEKTTSYKIYIEVSITGFKYTIFDSSSSTFIGLEEYRFDKVFNDFLMVEPLKKIIHQVPLLQKPFLKFCVAYVNQRSTLIPNAIFKQDQLALFHQYNFTKKEEDLFLYDSLINLSAKNIYSIPDYIYQLFESFKNVSFSHASSTLIEASLLQSKKEKALSLVDVHVLPNSFQIIAIKNQQLEIYNSFTYQTSEDFLYYLLFVLDQLKIDNEKATIRLLGEVEKNSTIYTMLYQYINTINFGDRSTNLKFSYILQDLPTHFHYSLFNQYLCE
jgi:hypothetical protein